MNVCTQCKQVWYCSADCQRKAWRTHKPQCLRWKEGKTQSSASLAPGKHKLINKALRNVMRVRATHSIAIRRSYCPSDKSMTCFLRFDVVLACLAVIALIACRRPAVFCQQPERSSAWTGAMLRTVRSSARLCWSVLDHECIGMSFHAPKQHQDVAAPVSVPCRS